MKSIIPPLAPIKTKANETFNNGAKAKIIKASEINLPTRAFHKARPYVRALICNDANWPAYRAEHGIRIVDLSSREQHLAVCRDLSIDVSGVFRV